MILLALLLYAGTYAIDDRLHPGRFVLDWMAVILLLVLIVVLVMADIRFTLKLRDDVRRRQDRGGGE